MLPQEWRGALDAAQKAGKIPNIPPSTVDASGNVHYSDKLANSPDVCSWTTMKCNGPNDIHQAPDNTWVVAFDDGPTNASPDLYGFLQSQNQSATHFMIGSNIVTNKHVFQQAASTGQELAVHTWSHQLMTSLSNEQVLGELGWTMQVIYDLSGRVPTLWRPPQGDLDNRVRAIAEQVFGLKAVMWDAECNDWCLQANGGSDCPGTVPGNTYQSVVDAVNKAVQMPKSPGVILLEHELTPQSVGIFKNAYPTIKSLGWQAKSVSDAFGQDWYTNAHDDADTPSKVIGMTLEDNKGDGDEEQRSSSSSTASAAAASTSATPASPSSSTGTSTSTASMTTLSEASSGSTVLPSKNGGQHVSSGTPQFHASASFVSILSLAALLAAACLV